MSFAKKMIFAWFGALTMLVCACNPSWAAAPEAGTFFIAFNSGFSNGAKDIQLGVLSHFTLDPVESLPGNFWGSGGLVYNPLGFKLFGDTGGVTRPVPGVLTINNLLVRPDGTVVVWLFPAEPAPAEYLLAGFFGPLVSKFNFWAGLFGNFHLEELGEVGFEIGDWEYPDADPAGVYARKTYVRTREFGGGGLEPELYTEDTLIEIIPVLEPPRIDKINIASSGASADDPETGKKLELTADLHTPLLYKVKRCTWTGSNFSGPGIGDPEDNCRWSYTPKEGDGPKRDTYGKKNLTLKVVWDYGIHKSAYSRSKSKDYKVFFTKKGDDNSDDEPNWFDYWGDDGAVPGLDGSDVEYDAATSLFGFFSSPTVFIGPIAADSDGEIIIPATADCAGGTFPGSRGIDIAAVTLAHEKKHKEIAALTGTHSDIDGVPDDAETGTSITNPDSCNLAGEINDDYKTYGDNEFIARQAELGVSGDAGNDWALPGRQATLKTGAGQAASFSASGLVVTPQSTIGISSSQVAALSATGLLTGSYSALGEDTNDDGLFESMRLDVGVNILDADHYTVVAWLADDQGTELLWARTEADLSAGASTLQVVFDGPSLHQAGVSQPFVVSRVELYSRVGKHNILADYASNVLDTTYVSADFNPPSATLSGSVAEQAVDTDLDGLYDLLEFTIDLDINEPGDYEVSAQLHGTSLLLSDVQTITVPTGVNSAQVTLKFAGTSIFFYRENGPYQLKWLRLRKGSQGDELDFIADAGTSSGYSFNEFQHSGITIDESSYADTGGELDANGKYLTLDLLFDISSMGAGPYTVSASLEDGQGGTITRTTASVGLTGLAPSNESIGIAEINSVRISFEAADVFAAGLDGPYQVTNVTIVSDAGVLMDQNPVAWLTAAYSVDDFGVVVVTEEVFTDGFE